MHLFHRFKRLFKNKSSKALDMWTSIDKFPIYNFHQTLKTGDLKYTLKSELSDKDYHKNFPAIEKNWDNLYDEYLEHFGLAKSHIRKMEIENKIAKLQIKRWLNNDKSLEAVIGIEHQRLNEVKDKKQKSSTFEEDVAVIEKYMSIGMDTEKVSVKMFYTYIKMMQKDGEKNK